jgi:Transposase DDE domain
MHNLIQSYELILKNLRKLDIVENAYFKSIKPKLSDLEIVALNINAEYLGIDSEYQLFRNLYGTYLFDKIERSVYNRRKRKLFAWMEQIRKTMVLKFNEFENCFIVDSMPLEVCKIARSNRTKICKEVDYAIPNRGFCASQQTPFYGYKLHAICSKSGIFQSFDLSPASVHDINFMKDIKSQISDCTVLGDRGYLSAEVQIDLFNSVNIKLETPMRSNQKNYKKQPYIFMKSRKRIETLFSQLCDQFMIRRNYSKTFLGFKTRILSKITALTMIQYLNKFVFERNINNLKINLIQ